ncbi:MAG: sigma-54 dependent transcriptional regulator [Bythopirellula sp.]|nr:sigma-54 dependent transcriptional regulator [Bythopirellula sp.]
MSKILVVDDEQAICWGLEKLGHSLGHQVFVASSAEQGLRLAAESQPDLLILDVRLPGMDGLSAMQEFRRHLGVAPIVVITAFGDLATAVKAVQNGAFEYVLKPFDLDEIRGTIRRAFFATQSPLGTETDLPVDGMLGKTPVMQAVFKRIALAANAEVTVLLQGESGVGKATAAHAIHRHSSRGAGPFITANLAALDATQAELELFGQVAGVLGGSSASRPGLLVEADGGTLFLEDITQIPLAVQVKLLRALEQEEVMPVGGDQPVKCNFRVISATDQNLLKKVQSGEFRQDLYYRLAAFEISIPPLRERQADIPILARHFASQRRGSSVNFAEETINEMMSRAWQGNVRELRNAIEHALVVSRAGLIMPEHLPTPLPALQSESDAFDGQGALGELAKQRAADLLGDPQADGFVYEKFLEEVEPALLESAMDRFSNECAPAARALGLHRTTLKRKLDQYGLAK